MQLPFLKKLPEPIQKFILRSILVFIVWKLLYHLVLYPIRVPDEQLTHITATITKELVQLNYPDKIIHVETIKHPQQKENILMENKKIVGIADGCNGLELYVLFVGFLFCFPASKKKFITYSLIGIALIFIANTLRSYIITLLNINGSSLSEVSHHYFFKLAIYAMMFFLWVKYTKSSLKNEE